MFNFALVITNNIIDMIDTNTKSISLNSLGINSSKVHYQLSSNELHSITLKKNQGKESSLGAIAINTGEFTGRSPMDRFIVKDSITKDKFGGEILIFLLAQITLTSYMIK